jgi:hypothetical protein
MILNKDFRDFIELLNSNNVRYLIVGGYALALHGHPRYTGAADEPRRAGKPQAFPRPESARSAGCEALRAEQAAQGNRI